MINKAILVGRLGKDPEVRYTPDGTMVTNFTMATDEVYKDKNRERTQRTEWHRIVTFGKLAEICGKYLVKGKLVYLEGKIEYQEWEHDGVKHYRTVIKASDMKMLDSKSTQTSAPEAAPEPAPPSLIDGDVPF